MNSFASFITGFRRNWPQVTSIRKLMLVVITLLGLAATIISTWVVVPAWTGTVHIPAYVLPLPIVYALILLGWLGD